MTAKMILHLGPPRIEWCDVCSTTSRVLIDFSQLGVSGVDIVGKYDKCARCAEVKA